MNATALSQLKFFYADLFDVVCFSHTLDNVGSHFEFQVFDAFIPRFWISFFSHSYNARLAWRERKLGRQFVPSVTHGGGVNGR